MLDRAQHLERWRALHHGYDPTGRPLVGAWLTAMYDAGALLARRGVSPDLLTFASGDLALAAWLVALAGGRWPLLSAGLLGCSAVLDGLDGAVAVIAQRETARGARLDRLVDRFGDLCFLAALVAVGAPRPLGAVAAAALLLFEGLRAVWAARARPGLAVVTAGERPTRLVLCALALVATAVEPGSAPAALGAAAVAGLCVLAMAQLAVAVRRG